MNVYNIFFSPTGGTKTVGSIIANGISKDVINLDLNKEPNNMTYSSEDLCIISVPSFGGRVPAVCSSHLKKLCGTNTKTILVAVFGNRAIDDTLIELYDIVKEQGFITIAAIEAVAEHSLARIYGTGRPNTKDQTELFEFAEAILTKLNNQDFTTPVIPGNRPYKEAKRSSMTLALNDNCISCKRCAKECPVDAISLEDVSIYDTEKCFSCMRCVSVCPMKARHNAPEVTAMFEERLRGRADGYKENKLYI